MLIGVLVTKLEGRLGQYFTPRVFGSWIITDVCQRVERGVWGWWAVAEEARLLDASPLIVAHCAPHEEHNCV